MGLFPSVVLTLRWRGTLGSPLSVRAGALRSGPAVLCLGWTAGLDTEGGS